VNEASQASGFSKTAGLLQAESTEVVSRKATRLRRVIIAIPTLNEVRHIESVLRQLVGEIPRTANVLIVVADGGSTDGTQAAVVALSLEYPSIHLLDNPARIQSAGINLAMRCYGREADVLVRCDAHGLYPPNYCERLLETLDRSDADAVVVAMDSVGATPLQRAIASVSNTIIGTGGAAHRAGYRSGMVDHGHHAAFRVDTFRRVGGYDASFSHNEDAEFDCRQRALGAKVYLDADIRVQYYPRVRWRDLARQYFDYGSGRSRTLRRHPTSLRLRQLLVPLNLVLCGFAVFLSPWLIGLLLLPALYFAVLAATSVALAVRHRSLDGLLAGPAAGVMHTAWAIGLISGWLRGHEKVWRPGAVAPLWGSNGGREG